MTEEQGRDAEALDRLAKSAIERFKTRLDWEWKARLGLWTVLAAATAFAFTSETWRPTNADFGLILGAMIFLVAVYGVCFAWAVHMLHAEDIRLWNACQRETATLIWGTAAGAVSAGAMPEPRHGTWASLLSLGQLLVTLLFAAALVFAVQSRVSAPDVDRPTASKVTIQQDIPSKVFVEPVKK
jgi:hypothetical protein